MGSDPFSIALRTDPLTRYITQARPLRVLNIGPLNDARKTIRATLHDRG